MYPGTRTQGLIRGNRVRKSGVGLLVAAVIPMTSVAGIADEFGTWQLREHRDKFDKGRYSCFAEPKNGSAWFASLRTGSTVGIIIRAPDEIKSSVASEKLRDYKTCQVQKALDRTVYCRDYDYPLADLKIEYIVNEGAVQTVGMSLNLDSDSVVTLGFDVENKIGNDVKVDYRVMLDTSPYTGKYVEEIYRGSVSFPSPADAYAASKECSRRSAENRQK